MKKYLSATANFYILFSILATPLIVVYKFDELSQKVKQPVIIYQADNAGVEMFGKVTGKGIIDGRYYVEIGAYGKVLVTKEQYEAIKVGDPIPEYLKKRGS